MSKLEQAARQLLEAVEDFEGYRQDIDTAIADLREALEVEPQPAAAGQEPVAHLYCGGQFGNELDEWEIDPVQYQCDRLNERFGALGKKARIPLYTAPQVVAVEQEPVGHREPQPAAVNREQIREVFMAHGFTIKDGQTDLKQYVYDAAYALLAQCVAAKPARQPARQPLSALPDGDIVFFSDRGDAVTGYSAQRVWEILRAGGEA